MQQNKIKIDYRILSGASARSLEEQVNDLCNDGYMPQGGVTTSYVGSTVLEESDTKPEMVLFSQAMVLVTPEVQQ